MAKAAGRIRTLAPLAAAALVCAAGFAGLDRGLASAAYDAFAALRPPAEPSRSILLVGVDEEALAEAGPLPWKRGDLSEGLAALTEADASLVLLDLPLAEVSEPDLAPSSNASRLAQSFDLEFAGISENIVGFYDALRLGSIAPSEASRILAQILESIAEGKERLLDAVLGAEGLDEASLGGEARANGRVFFGLELLDPASGRAAASPELVAGFALRPVLSASPPFRRVSLAAPDSAALARAARGAGFREPEGGAAGGGGTALGESPRRSALLAARSGGAYVGSAAFAAVLDYLGSPSISFLPGAAKLGGARYPGMPPRDISIPLTEDRRLLFARDPSPESGSGGAEAAKPEAGRRPAAEEPGFRTLSWALLSRYARREAELAAALVLISGLSDGADEGRASIATGQSAYAAGLRSELPDAPSGERATRLRAWRDARDSFFVLAAGAVGEDAEAATLDRMDRRVAAEEPRADRLREALARRDRVAEGFAAARTALDGAMAARAALGEAAAGSFCIATFPAASGGGPGRAACEADALLSGSWILPLPRILSLAIGALLGILAALAGPRLPRWAGVAAALAWAAAAGGASLGLFLASSVWLDPVAPALAPAAALALAALLRRSPAGTVTSS